jgi:hypothetical protein
MSDGEVGLRMPDVPGSRRAEYRVDLVTGRVADRLKELK